MMKLVKVVKPMFSKVNDYARNNSPQQISNFDLVSSIKTGQPSQKWSNSKVEILRNSDHKSLKKSRISSKDNPKKNVDDLINLSTKSFTSSP